MIVLNISLCFYHYYPDKGILVKHLTHPATDLVDIIGFQFGTRKICDDMNLHLLEYKHFNKLSRITTISLHSLQKYFGFYSIKRQ